MNFRSSEYHYFNYANLYKKYTYSAYKLQYGTYGGLYIHSRKNDMAMLETLKLLWTWKKECIHYRVCIQALKMRVLFWSTTTFLERPMARILCFFSIQALRLWVLSQTDTIITALAKTGAISKWPISYAKTAICHLIILQNWCYSICSFINWIFENW